MSRSNSLSGIIVGIGQAYTPSGLKYKKIFFF